LLRPFNDHFVGESALGNKSMTSRAFEQPSPLNSTTQALMPQQMR
jgi:hypothetical protein